MLGFLRRLLRSLRKKRFSYEPLLEVRIYREALLHNLRVFQNLDKKIAIAPVLKSNAYGHGLKEVAALLDSEELPFLCIDSFFEALILRNEGVETPLLVLGYTPLQTMLESRLTSTAFGVISLDGLRGLTKEARRPIAIHLKVDTGMHRHGILPEEVGDAIALLKAHPRIRLEGVYSHLADADTPNSAHAKEQMRTWNDIAQRFRTAFPSVQYFHCAATAGAGYGKSIEANVMRIGLGLYGVNAGATLDLQPALEVRTGISSLRSVHAGETVGYNATYKAPKDMVLATIPAGYYEGVDRRLSNKGTVLVKNTPCPIVGRISMNITSFDVSHIPNVRIGERVIVISVDNASPNSVESIASTCETIPYEILVHIPAHLRRTVV